MSQSPAQPNRYMRYVGLVYLGTLFFQPLFDPSTDAMDWLAVAVLIAVFLPIYAATFRADGDRQTLILIALLGGLAVAGSLVNSGAGVFAIYAAATAGRLYPARRAVAVVAALMGLIAVMIMISRDPEPWRLATFVAALVFTPVVGATSIFDAERERASRRLRRADEEIERLATVAERQRIARDLHDLLGHTLSVIVLKSELASRLVHVDPDRATAEVEEIEQIGRQALGEVRAAVTGYRSRGLRAELDGARVALAAADIDIDIDVPPHPTDLRPDQETALAMALREAVTNVVRHAEARHATISITTLDGHVRLRVTDDGRGSAGLAGSGITGMRERIAALGGHLEVGDPKGSDNRRGTVVDVSLPLDATANDTRAAEERGGP